MSFDLNQILPETCPRCETKGGVKRIGSFDSVRCQQCGLQFDHHAPPLPHMRPPVAREARRDRLGCNGTPIPARPWPQLAPYQNPGMPPNTYPQSAAQRYGESGQYSMQTMWSAIPPPPNSPVTEGIFAETPIQYLLIDGSLSGRPEWPSPPAATLLR